MKSGCTNSNGAPTFIICAQLGEADGRRRRIVPPL